MFKNRKLILLTILTGIVWAMIGYRIYDYLTSVPEIPISVRRFSLSVDKEIHYALLLDYKDPFLKMAVSPVNYANLQNRPTAKSSKTKTKEAIAESSINWASIKFLGSMDNATRKSCTAIILIQNTEHFMKEGESIDGFTILKVLKDSVEVQYATFRKFLKR